MPPPLYKKKQCDAQHEFSGELRGGKGLALGKSGQCPLSLQPTSLVWNLRMSVVNHDLPRTVLSELLVFLIKPLPHPDLSPSPNLAANFHQVSSVFLKISSGKLKRSAVGSSPNWRRSSIWASSMPSRFWEALGEAARMVPGKAKIGLRHHIGMSSCF